MRWEGWDGGGGGGGAGAVRCTYAATQITLTHTKRRYKPGSPIFFLLCSLFQKVTFYLFFFFYFTYIFFLKLYLLYRRQNPSSYASGSVLEDVAINHGLYLQYLNFSIKGYRWHFWNTNTESENYMSFCGLCNTFFFFAIEINRGYFDSVSI